MDVRFKYQPSDEALGVGRANGFGYCSKITGNPRGAHSLLHLVDVLVFHDHLLLQLDSAIFAHDGGCSAAITPNEVSTVAVSNTAKRLLHDILDWLATQSLWRCTALARAVLRQPRPNETARAGSIATR